MPASSVLGRASGITAITWFPAAIVAGITTQPEEYERQVIGFFDHALLHTE